MTAPYDISIDDPEDWTLAEEALAALRASAPLPVGGEQ
jgi:hypothetical protein